MPVVRVTSKGQATIPKELREKYGIAAPGKVSVRELDGRIVVEPVQSLEQLRRLLRDAPGPSVDAIREEARRAERRGERRLERMGRRRSRSP